MNKKIIILSSIVVILAVIGGALLFFSKGDNEDGNNGLSQFFPFFNNDNGNGEGFIPQGTIYPLPSSINRNLIQLFSQSISGTAFMGDKVRYIEKATGHIFDVNIDGGERNRISNTTILKSFETLWSFDAKNVVIRYFEDNNSALSVRNFSGSTASSSLEGIFLPADAKTLAVSPSESRVFYLIPSGGNNLGMTADFNDKKQEKVLTVPFGDFNATWPSKNIIAFNTRPSKDTEGSLYLLNLKTKGFEKILSGMNGLTSLVSPQADKVLFSQIISGKIISKIFNIAKNETNDFPIATLAEKCVWGVKNKEMIYCAMPSSLPSASYPDDWYKGLISFDDAIWSVNLETGEVFLLAEKTGLDIINPVLDSQENYMIFMNKKDSSLWILDLLE